MKKSTFLGKFRYFYLLILISVPIVMYYQLHKASNVENVGVRLGGKFTLTNQENIRVSNNDMQTDYLLIFFGFTNCHMVCPTGMDNISNALKALDSNLLEKVTPIFITIDPERDDSETIKEFLTPFHKKFIGLTGSQTEIQTLVKEFGVFSSKEELDENNDYQVNHSSYIYLTSREGDYIAHNFYNVDTKNLTEFLQKYLN